MNTARLGFPQPLLSVVLFVVWQLLSDGVSGASVVMGLILAWLIPRLTHGFWPDQPRVGRPWVYVVYVFTVAYDIVVASISVAALVLSGRQPRPAFVSYPLRLEHPLAVTILASSISLTPGTVSADVSDDGRMLLIHALDVTDQAELIATIHKRYETPLLEIFQ